MKKSIIIAALMCCIVSLAAQQTPNEPEALKSMKAKIQHVERLNRHENNFSVKLDSVIGESAKFLYEYDDRLNCTKESRYYSEGVKDWWLQQSFENTYDEQNRLTSVTHLDTYYNSTTKEEYIYNTQGLIKEEIHSYLSDSAWKLTEKFTFEYDEAGNMVLLMKYEYAYNDWYEKGKEVCEYENGLLQNETFYSCNAIGEWQPETKFEYAYNAQGLCKEEHINYYGDNEWVLYFKTEYAYNEQSLCSEMIKYERYYDQLRSFGRYLYEYDESGNKLSMIYFDHRNDSPEWSYVDKYEYSYDDHNNCTAYHLFAFNYGEWRFDYGYDMTYEASVSIEQIAGLNRIWNAAEMDVPIYSKLLQFKIWEDEDESFVLGCYYSDHSSLDEPTKNHLTIWPNPATETVHIEGSEAAEVQVYNTLGQMVKTVQGSNEINVSSLVEGVYLLRVTDAEGKNYTARVAVKK